MNRNQVGIVANGGTTGQTDFKAYGSNLVGISGCMVLLVDSGCAIVSVGFKRRVLCRGMMAMLFYDDTFWIEQSSRTFRCRYVALADDNVQEAIYKLTSPYFWDSLSENPLFLLNDRQQQLLNAWYEQMVWICHNSASEYTNQLCITTTYLYKLTHKRWNLSPKELIDKQTICEIKSLLSNTDMSIKEIASTLHFEDTPYMCRYFRQRTGLSPTEYRERNI